MQDNNLIQACKDNQQWAQLQLYHKYKQDMLRLCWRILKDESRAKDVVHDAFIKAFKGMHALEVDSNLGAWLRRIAVNAALDVWKKQQRERLVDTELPTVYSSGEDIDESHSMEEILAAIAGLPAKYRMVLELYLLDDYSHKEIAVFLQTNYSTVRNQYVRGKQLLINRLKKIEHGVER
ncbi:MAG: RNA polymerase sigma factor [Flavobacteriaceae bacterium]|nr:RNA polymerase sigma factor [Flavobacteriaceae bacterium]